MNDKAVVMAMDAGTTGIRAILFDRSGAVVAQASQEFTQIYPKPGWVEHDPVDIWNTQLTVAHKVLDLAGIGADRVAAIGITNQRETTVVWDRHTGHPVHNAIVWQDRRTAGRCDQLKAKGLTEHVRRTTGLVVDAYFSGTKIDWILRNVPGARERAAAGDLLFGTVDSWLIWNLTGGAGSPDAVHVTDYSNASRTMLFDINRLEWDPVMLAELDIPRAMLPRVRPTSEVYGHTDASVFFGVRIPVAAAVGDQHGALFGQTCFEPGMVKSTYGTGASLLMNTGAEPVFSEKGLLTTVAWGVDGQLQKRSSLTEFAGPALALLVILVIVALTTPNFLATDNFQNIAMQAAVLSIVAIGSTVVILTGGIDLSPGSMIALLTMLLASLMKLDGWPLLPAILAVLVGGALLGAINGFFVSYLKIPAFIVTLAALSGFKGLALTIGGGTPIFSLSPALETIFYGQVFGIPLPFLYVVVLYAIAIVVLNFTTFGREIYAIGGNENAARLSGVRVKRVRMLAFVIAGGCAAIGAVLLSARLNSGSPNYGTLIELQAIAAAVVGGASLAGGRGHIFNTLIGVLIITVVQNSLNLNAVSPAIQSIAIGLIILIAVGIDIWRGQLTRNLLSTMGRRREPALAGKGN